MVTDPLNAFEMFMLLALKTLEFCGVTHYAYLQLCFELYRQLYVGCSIFCNWNLLFLENEGKQITVGEAIVPISSEQSRRKRERFGHGHCVT